MRIAGLQQTPEGAAKPLRRGGKTPRGAHRTTSSEGFAGRRKALKGPNPKSGSGMKQGRRGQRGQSPQGPAKGRRGKELGLEPSKTPIRWFLNAEGARNLRGGANSWEAVRRHWPTAAPTGVSERGPKLERGPSTFLRRCGADARKPSRAQRTPKRDRGTE
jgi:hypothetical protein